MPEDRLERTEKATPRKRHEAREKGQVAKSKEISSAVVLFAGLGVFYFFGDSIVINTRTVVSDYIAQSGGFELSEANSQVFFKKVIGDMLLIMAPFVILPLAGLAANIAQVGFLFTAEPLKPKFSRLNPIEGTKKLFAVSALVELVKSLLKLSVVGYMAYAALSGEIANMVGMIGVDTAGLLMYLGQASFKVLVMTSWVLIVIAALDYGYQFWEHERNLRMTKHEIKEEHKDIEGQPMVKARIRSLQRKLARQRMMQEVPKATVIITNPTHVAVALKYEQGQMKAPLVVAKGAGLVAQRIKEIAKESGVPAIENKILARILWKTCEIGLEIPSSLYTAVAEVLAYVYKLKARRKPWQR
ncbi:MAG: flagellar biosynthesis protein FlhB [Deltaproteobacteria bacterium]|nr:flagellar biosynthesis protein FlhB [Deltaproteobacteria bacterium]